MLPGGAEAAITCDQTITADVVVLDNPTVFNRLGAQNPNWITYALRRDVVDVRTGTPDGHRRRCPARSTCSSPATSRCAPTSAPARWWCARWQAPA